MPTLDQNGFYAPRNSEEERDWIDFIKRHPQEFKKVKCRNGRIDLAAVRALPENIRYVENPSPAVQLTAVKKDPSLIKDIRRVNYEVAKYLAAEHPVYLTYIKGLPEDIVCLMLESLDNFTYKNTDFMYIIWQNLQSHLRTADFARQFARYIPITKAPDFTAGLRREVFLQCLDELIDAFPALAELLYLDVEESEQTKDRALRILQFEESEITDEFVKSIQREWVNDLEFAPYALARACDRLPKSWFPNRETWVKAVALNPEIREAAPFSQDAILRDAANLNPQLYEFYKVADPTLTDVYQALSSGEFSTKQYTHLPESYFRKLLVEFPQNFAGLFYLIGTHGENRLSHLQWAHAFIPEDELFKQLKYIQFTQAELSALPRFAKSCPWVLKVAHNIPLRTYHNIISKSPEAYPFICANPPKASSKEFLELTIHALDLKPSLFFGISDPSDELYAYMCENKPYFINQIYMAYTEPFTRWLVIHEYFHLMKHIKNPDYNLCAAALRSSKNNVKYINSPLTPELRALLNDTSDGKTSCF